MKYELIKEYPGSPELGTIEWFECNDHGGATSKEWRGTYCYNSYPEFWQKAEEVDYEILSFQDKLNRKIITYRKSKNVFIVEGARDDEFKGNSLQEELKYVYDGYYIIHSVKRLSDGEVFTIGDKINVFDSVSGVQIKSFDVRTALWVNYDGGSCTVNIPEKLKNPLFTTEDGVEIFEGDSFSAVQLSTFHLLEKCAYKTGDGFINFSTKEKAENYILLNKPCLSLIDVSKAYDHLLSFNNGNSMRLRNIVKSRL